MPLTYGYHMPATSSTIIAIQINDVQMMYIYHLYDIIKIDQYLTYTAIMSTIPVLLTPSSSSSSSSYIFFCIEINDDVYVFQLIDSMIFQFNLRIIILNEQLSIDDNDYYSQTPIIIIKRKLQFVLEANKIMQFIL